MQKLALDTDIQPWEVPGFYAALRRLSGMTATPKNYPLLQCKTRWQESRLQPLLLALGERQPDWQTILTQPNQMIQLHERRLPLQVAHAAIVTFELRQTDRLRSYRLYNFQPFDREHYLQYRYLQEDVEKLQLIEQCLSRHLVHFARGVGWPLNGPAAVAELEIFREKLITYMGQKMHCFDLGFRTNIFLPEYIGLGKGASKGFGVVRKTGAGKTVTG